jgi:hypothetical protein
MDITDIKNPSETLAYWRKNLSDSQVYIADLREQMQSEGYTEEQVERGLEPASNASTPRCRKITTR